MTILRLGAKRLTKFPASFGTLVFEERIDARKLGDVIRDALADIKHGITPMLRSKVGSALAPPTPPTAASTFSAQADTQRASAGADKTGCMPSINRRLPVRLAPEEVA